MNGLFVVDFDEDDADINVSIIDGSGESGVYIKRGVADVTAVDQTKTAVC